MYIYIYTYMDRYRYRRINLPRPHFSAVSGLSSPLIEHIAWKMSGHREDTMARSAQRGRPKDTKQLDLHNGSSNIALEGNETAEHPF